ncbi:MAG TPA: tetraacyldisaccharide 4'-kinase [Candidatus Aphodousia gallistercoris]|nr:tetraacyldisaccharide 4'-kinase [Candidatus Aphodousia gallistercoris]
MRAGIESWLHRQWTKRGLLALALSPLSLIFLCVAKNRRMRTVPTRLPVPVVVVGNIYVGGTGKTPVTIALVRELARRGYHPGVVSRGFGRKEDGAVMVKADSPAQRVGDEPLLIAKETGVPVAVARDRVEAALLLLDKYPQCDLIISDDGLQHYGLARDVELAVVGARGLGNGWVLPAGPLREPPSRLDQVDAIVLNATEEEIESRTPRFAATAILGKAKSLDGQKSLDLDEIAASGKSVFAAAGIAAPGRFFAMLRAHDIEGETEELGDHFAFHTNPFKDRPEEIILITGKDAVKCRQNPEIMKDGRIYQVEYLVDIDPYLVDFIENKLKEKAQKNAH